MDEIRQMLGYFVLILAIAGFYYVMRLGLTIPKESHKHKS